MSSSAVEEPSSTSGTSQADFGSLHPFLQHSGFPLDQKTVLNVEQSAKVLQELIARALAGQLPVHLDTNRPRQADEFVQWLRKHAGLVRQLDISLGISNELWYATGTPGSNRWSGPLAALEGLLKDAAAASALGGHDSGSPSQQLLQLDLFRLAGQPARSSLLQHLSAARLKQLCVQLPTHSSSDTVASVAAIARLPALRCLELQLGCAGSAALMQPGEKASWQLQPDGLLYPLQALQLTQLCVGPVRLPQLQQLPPSLQHLHVVLEIRVKAAGQESLPQLAEWLAKHARILCTLELPQRHAVSSGWAADEPQPGEMPAFNGALGVVTHPSLSNLAAAVQAAAAAAAPAAAEHTSTTLLDSSKLPRLSAAVFNSDGTSAAAFLPGLTRLECSLDWIRNADTGALCSADISALCSLTALRSLAVYKPSLGSGQVAAADQPDDALKPLSALQQLTQLQLSAVRKKQLQHLQLPLLRELTAFQRLQSVDARSREPRVLPKQLPGTAVQLGHLAALTGWQCGVTGALLCCRMTGCHRSCVS
jgi:hypothetical protein